MKLLRELLEQAPGLPATKDRTVGIMNRSKKEGKGLAKPRLKRRGQKAARHLRGSHGLGHPKGQHWSDEDKK